MFAVASAHARAAGGVRAARGDHVNPRIIATEPLGYIEFMNLVARCTLAITDSGGVQEETTYLGIPCATLRENTERPVTVTEGTNRLMSADKLVGCGADRAQGRVAEGPASGTVGWQERAARH